MNKRIINYFTEIQDSSGWAGDSYILNFTPDLTDSERYQLMEMLVKHKMLYDEEKFSDIDAVLERPKSNESLITEEILVKKWGFLVLEGKMVERRTWDELREAGLLLFVNQFLHIFGWAIVVVINKGVVTDSYPARVKFRGFSKDRASEAYIKLSEYMDNNAEELLKESKL